MAGREERILIEADAQSISRQLSTANCDKCTSTYAYRALGKNEKAPACPKCGEDSIEQTEPKLLGRAALIGLVCLTVMLALGLKSPLWLLLPLGASVVLILAARRRTPKIAEKRTARAVSFYGWSDSSQVDNETLERTLARTVRRSLLLMAKIDGVVESSEMVAVSELYQRCMGERVTLEVLELEMSNVKKNYEGLLDELHVLAPFLSDVSKILFVKTVLAVATADGFLAPKEKQLAELLANQLELPKSDFEILLREAVRTHQKTRRSR